MIEDKDIKIQINEYHKLLENIKVENIILPDEFVSELPIKKLTSSWTDYKQQLKHRHKKMSLHELITHIIVEDTNRHECAIVRAKALLAKANIVEEKHAQKMYENKPVHKRKVIFEIYILNDLTPSLKKGKLLPMWEAWPSCTLVQA